MELTLPVSKTDPSRHGIQLLIASRDNARCPVAAMRPLPKIDGHKPPFAPLFRVVRENQHPFTQEHVVQKLQFLAIRNGLGLGA